MKKSVLVAPLLGLTFAAGTLFGPVATTHAQEWFEGYMLPTHDTSHMVPCDPEGRSLLIRKNLRADLDAYDAGDIDRGEFISRAAEELGGEVEIRSYGC